MKKILSYLVLVSILILGMSSVAFASENELDLVTDAAYLLTDDEFWDLNDRADEISEKYECDIHVITLEEIGDEDPYDFVEYLYDQYNIGYGSKRSSLILLLSMSNRDYALVAYGYGNTAFTDYGKDVMLDQNVLPLLSKGQYFEAFSKYYDVAEEYLEMAYSGSPFDKSTDSGSRKMGVPIKLVITFGLPFMIAFLICGRWKSQMKTAVLARGARNYIPQNGFSLAVQEDRFLYRTETRQKIEKPSSSEGTTTRSSGSSGRSGKF